MGLANLNSPLMLRCLKQPLILSKNPEQYVKTMTPRDFCAVHK